jgi:hypothetical protein
MNSPLVGQGDKKEESRREDTAHLYLVNIKNDADNT